MSQFDSTKRALQEACPEQFATYMKFRKQVLQTFRSYEEDEAEAQTA